MSTTKSTFEDRLLAELTSEIERRREDVPDGGGSRSKARMRRLAVVAAACAAAWVAAVVVPGSPAGAKAYAVEPHGDGSVTLRVKDQELDIGAQHELAREVRPLGIQVTVEVIAEGYVCERDRDRFERPGIWAIAKDGSLVPIRGLDARSTITLHRGDLLVFENTKGYTRPNSVKAYADKADYQPCVPVKPKRKSGRNQ
ncbi:hypothetical protein [Streptomyces lanatus]|uniref:Uncharacterized protein n=1 Tax=Streptomyces lanatus TaxID=66900 RepID=A0ABV1XRQ0_9ACTN|nr:hypothetical protein [Streptomyces lanatus]GHH04672.1 hypothetical protein GCM10018780_35370 [Streptomyces lanatus]